MPTPSCKNCIHFDTEYGRPGRCKLVMDTIRHKMHDGIATKEEIRYFIRTDELPDEYWQWICDKFEQKQINEEPISLTPDEVRDLWWYIYSLSGCTVHIESALRGEKVFNRIDAKLKVGLEMERLKAFDKMFGEKEDI